MYSEVYLQVKPSGGSGSFDDSMGADAGTSASSGTFNLCEWLLKSGRTDDISKRDQKL